MQYLKYILLFIGALIPFVKDTIDSFNVTPSNTIERFKKLKVMLISLAFLCSCFGIWLAWQDENKSQYEKIQIVINNRRDSLNIENNLRNTKKTLEDTKMLLHSSSEILVTSNSTNQILSRETSQIQQKLTSQINENSKLKFPIEDNFQLIYTLSLDIEENKLQTLEKLVLQNIQITELDIEQKRGIGVLNKQILNLEENYLNYLTNVYLHIDFINKKKQAVLGLGQQYTYPFYNEDDFTEKHLIRKNIHEGIKVVFDHRLNLYYYPLSRRFTISGYLIPLQYTLNPNFASLYDIQNTDVIIRFNSINSHLPKPVTKLNFTNTSQKEIDYLNSINSEFKYKFDDFRITTKSGISISFNKLKRVGGETYETKAHILGIKKQKE